MHRGEQPRVRTHRHAQGHTHTPTTGSLETHSHAPATPVHTHAHTRDLFTHSRPHARPQPLAFLGLSVSTFFRFKAVP